MGESRWCQMDLAGSLYEWTRDMFKSNFYGTLTGTCVDCNQLDGIDPTVRGGCWSWGHNPLRAAARMGSPHNDPATTIGFRCARDP